MHLERERVAKVQPMPIFESNHKMAKPGNDLNGHLANHGHLQF